MPSAFAQNTIVSWLWESMRFSSDDVRLLCNLRLDEEGLAFAEPLHLAHANLSWCKACTLLRSNGILTQSDGHPHAERHSARWTLNDSFNLFPGSGGKQIRLPPSQPVLSCGDSRDRLVSGVQRRRLVPERNLQANAASSLVLSNGRT